MARGGIGPGAVGGQLRVGIDARLIDGVAGGVQQAIIGLAAGLGRLADGDEEYLFLTYAGHDAWLSPFLGPNTQTLECPAPPQITPTWRSRLSVLPMLRRAYGHAKVLLRPASLGVPQSDGLIERAGVQAMHFTTPMGFYTRVPTLYQPWDLQHRHLPQYFHPDDYARREIWYQALCEQARCVVVATSWAKSDLIAHYGLVAEKIQVVPVAPVVESYPAPTAEQIARLAEERRLPDRFIFYPAQSWAHKNHLMLLEALALLRDQGLVVNLVMSGARNHFYRRIEQRIRALELSPQVWHVGYIGPLELQCLYHLSRCLVFPSLFEGWGLPLTEAFWVGRPIGCSNVTSLPDLVGDAALLFDPERPDAIAAAIRRLWTDDQLCRELVARGKRRVEALSLERSARTVRAIYRRLAGRSLDADDQALLSAAPLV